MIYCPPLSECCLPLIEKMSIIFHCYSSVEPVLDLDPALEHEQLALEPMPKLDPKSVESQNQSLCLKPKLEPNLSKVRSRVNVEPLGQFEFIPEKNFALTLCKAMLKSEKLIDVVLELMTKILKNEVLDRFLLHDRLPMPQNN